MYQTLVLMHSDRTCRRCLKLGVIWTDFRKVVGRDISPIDFTTSAEQAAIFSPIVLRFYKWLRLNNSKGHLAFGPSLTLIAVADESRRPTQVIAPSDCASKTRTCGEPCYSFCYLDIVSVFPLSVCALTSLCKPSCVGNVGRTWTTIRSGTKLLMHLLSAWP